MNQLLRRVASGLIQVIARIRDRHITALSRGSGTTHELALDLIRQYPDPFVLMATVDTLDISEEQKTDVLIAVGGALQSLSRIRESLSVWAKALEYAIRSENPSDEAMCYGALGQIYRRTGEWSKAVEFLNRALNMFERMQDRKDASTCHTSLGNIYSQLDSFREAISHYEKALELLSPSNDRESRAICLNGLGVVYGHLKDNVASATYFEEALKTYKELGDKGGQAGTYSNLANCYTMIGEFSLAQTYASKGLELSKETGDRRHEADCYGSLAHTHYALTKAEKAIEYNIAALGIYKDVAEKLGEISCYNNIGAAYTALGNHAKAIEYYVKSLEWFRQQRDLRGASTVVVNIANAHLYQHHIAEAHKYYLEAADLLDEMRQMAVPEAHGKEFWAENVHTFDNLILTSVKLSKLEDALTQCEKARSTILPDMMHRPAGGLESLLPPGLSAREIKQLAVRIRRNIFLFRTTKSGSFAFLVNRMGEMEVVEIKGFTTGRLTELLFRFDGPEPSDGWMATYMRYKTSQNAIIQAATAEERAEAVKTMRDREMKWRKSMEETLCSLYEELLQDVFRHVPPGERVVVLPTRSLGILPMHAAFREDRGRKRYLIEDYEISFAPNCRTLDLCHRREEENQSHGGLFAVANPLPPYDLEYSEWEVEEISKFFHEREIHVREDAREALFAGMDRWAVIHLATHGIYDLCDPLRSRLAMGNGINLTLGDILNRVRVARSGCWMMCLSACESGLSDYRDIADEQIGFQTAFLYGGIPSVVGSLWIVDDFTTAVMMVKMYEGIFSERKSKVQALRDAQLWLKNLTAREASEIIKKQSTPIERANKMFPQRMVPIVDDMPGGLADSRPFSHPYYWAGFQLFGV